MVLLQYFSSLSNLKQQQQQQQQQQHALGAAYVEKWSCKRWQHLWQRLAVAKTRAICMVVAAM